jgi:hypothetical protein
VNGKALAWMEFANPNGVRQSKNTVETVEPSSNPAGVEFIVWESFTQGALRDPGL